MNDFQYFYRCDLETLSSFYMQPKIFSRCEKVKCYDENGEVELTDQGKEKFRWVNTSPYEKISVNAIMTYTLFLDRTSLSVSSNSENNAFIDSDGHAFIIYSTEELTVRLNCSANTVRKIKDELSNLGLIKEVRQGLSKPNRIYVSKLGSETNEQLDYENNSNQVEKDDKTIENIDLEVNAEFANQEAQNLRIKKRKNCGSRNADFELQEAQNLNIKKRRICESRNAKIADQEAQNLRPIYTNNIYPENNYTELINYPPPHQELNNQTKGNFEKIEDDEEVKIKLKSNQNLDNLNQKLEVCFQEHSDSSEPTNFAANQNKLNQLLAKNPDLINFATVLTELKITAPIDQLKILQVIDHGFKQLGYELSQNNPELIAKMSTISAKTDQQRFFVILGEIFVEQLKTTKNYLRNDRKFVDYFIFGFQNLLNKYFRCFSGVTIKLKNEREKIRTEALRSFEPVTIEKWI